MEEKEEKEKGGDEEPSNLPEQRTLSQPAFNSNPLHRSLVFCTHLAFKSEAREDKTRGVDGKVIHILLPLARSFTSAIICVYWKLWDKKKRRRKKQVAGRKKNNKRRQRRHSPVWINYILKNLLFASVSVENLNKCQMPLCVQLFIVGGFLFFLPFCNCAGNIKFA